jgi:lipid II:glycine glycyltransferase (peptidoglycan interpeptide bridge formation enzyme)
MQAKIITSQDKNTWNDFVANAVSSPVLQSYEWGELKAKFGWQPIRLALEDNGKVVAAISILKREIPYIHHSLFYAPRGPVVNLFDRELTEALLAAVEEEAEKQHAISLKIDPELPDIPAKQSENFALLHKLGFVKSIKQVQPRATILLDLTPDLDSLLKSFETKTRYNIRLAEKKGVVVRQDDSMAGIHAFYSIYQETSVRDKFMIHPLKYYKAIREEMFANGLGSNFIAYYNDKPIASVIVFNFGSRLWYMYGASSNEYRNVMPNHLLHWEVIKWAKNKGLKTYDLWGIPANPREGHPLHGVYRFKQGFNGNAVKFIGAYDFPYSPLFYHAFEWGAMWWKNLNSLMRKGKIEDSLGE